MGLWVRKETGVKRPEYYVRWKIIQTEKNNHFIFDWAKRGEPILPLGGGEKMIKTEKNYKKTNNVKGT
jgi:hypothetical protein